MCQQTPYATAHTHTHTHTHTYTHTHTHTHTLTHTHTHTQRVKGQLLYITQSVLIPLSVGVSSQPLEPHWTSAVPPAVRRTSSHTPHIVHTLHTIHLLSQLLLLSPDSLLCPRQLCFLPRQLFLLHSGIRACFEVKKYEIFSLKLLHSIAMALPALYGYRAVGHILTAEYVCTFPCCSTCVCEPYNMHSAFIYTCKNAVFGVFM